MRKHSAFILKHSRESFFFKNSNGTGPLGVNNLILKFIRFEEIKGYREMLNEYWGLRIEYWGLRIE